MTPDMKSGTVEAIPTFLDWATSNPELHPTTVQAIRSAWRTVPSVLGIPPLTKVETLDADAMMDDFERLRGPNFRSGPTYRTRLRVGQQLYLAWLSGDPEWVAVARTKALQKGGLNSMQVAPQALVVREFPLRHGLTAMFQVPLDLTRSEVSRIGRFLDSLVIDDDEDA